MDRKKIAEFLQNDPLYRKISLGKEEIDQYSFYDQTFDFHCNEDKKVTTFQLSFPKKKEEDLFDGIPGHRINSEAFGEDQTVKFTQHYKGGCQQCKRYSIDLLLEVFTEDDTIFLRKIGQFPPREINPGKELEKFLTEEDFEFYKKALLNLEYSFGIGAFAYFRRIVENEILRLIKEVADLNDSESLKEKIKKHEKEHKLSELIDETFKYLPDTLKNLGENPFKLIYGKLSVGIHELSEEDCFEIAQSVDHLLRFVIKKLNEEKFESKNVRIYTKIEILNRPPQSVQLIQR